MIGNGTCIKIIKHKGLGDYREWICKKWLKHKRKQFQKTQTRHEFCSAPLYAAYRNAGSWSVELLFSTLCLRNTLCEILICSHCPGTTSGQRIFDQKGQCSTLHKYSLATEKTKSKISINLKTEETKSIIAMPIVKTQMKNLHWALNSKWGIWEILFMALEFIGKKRVTCHSL